MKNINADDALIKAANRQKILMQDKEASRQDLFFSISNREYERTAMEREKVDAMKDIRNDMGYIKFLVSWYLVASILIIGMLAFYIMCLI